MNCRAVFPKKHLLFNQWVCEAYFLQDPAAFVLWALAFVKKTSVSKHNSLAFQATDEVRVRNVADTDSRSER